MTAGGPMNRTDVGDSVGGGDRGGSMLEGDTGGDGGGGPTNAPEHEPAAAILRDDEPGPGPSAPEDPAPDLDEISSGDGPGVSPGE